MPWRKKVVLNLFFDNFFWISRPVLFVSSRWKQIHHQYSSAGIVWVDFVVVVVVFVVFVVFVVTNSRNNWHYESRHGILCFL